MNDKEKMAAAMDPKAYAPTAAKRPEFTKADLARMITGDLAHRQNTLMVWGFSASEAYAIIVNAFCEWSSKD